MDFKVYLKDKIKLNEWKEIIFRKENIISVIISAIFLIGINFLGSYFVDIMWFFIGILLLILISIIMIIAGFTVLKSLFKVAAGLSLIIFLAQSYCVVPINLRGSINDDALRTLLLVAFLYILFIFLKDLKETLKGHYNTVKDEKWSSVKIFDVSLYLTFVILFIREVFLVMQPIVLNLCI
ncbi:hypothetical protein ACFLYY_01570 [Patescibacteria group bacterium]